MLVWALQEMGYRGEQWGFVGAALFSCISLPVMLLLLLPGTILITTLGRKWMRVGFRVFLIITLVAGVVMNVAAFACIHLDRKARRQELQKRRPVYASGLYDAVRKGDADKAESILKSSSQAILGHTLDKSLLAWAVNNDDQTMVELLLKHGADVEDGGGGHPSPLHFAARRGNVAIARILLEHGADINAEESISRQETPLVSAQNAGETAMVQFLKSKGADVVNIKREASRAQDDGRIDELRSILDDGFNVNERWGSGTLLHFAAGDGQMDIVVLLLDRGAQIDASAGIGTPLHAAANGGHVDVIEYLIRGGADPDVVESRNYTPLYWASQKGHIEAVRVLLENGADPNLGRSAMVEAERHGHSEVVTLLKQHGAKKPADSPISDPAQ
jgi:ankyrin repeat protein